MQTNTGRNLNHVQDVDTILQDDASITSTQNGEIASSEKILDLGGDTFVQGIMVVNVKAIVINDNDELYEILLQGSTDSGFASDIQDLASVELGALEVLNGDNDTVIGRVDVPFVNDHNGEAFQFLRARIIVSGTTPSIDVEIFLAK